jgi:hypothetical protein
MSIHVSALPASIPNATHKINHSLAVYQPSIWGDNFLSYDSEINRGKILFLAIYIYICNLYAF